ncbi:hypothetical protein M5K25_023142 [Dendrobium thyrsiflorum]|uniref:Uncharacterized protein n=1 Tax=Dendrobium thyrsiflorum TaxID=117978 RepID=A0ABD0UEQ0_DENTH
MNVAEIDRISNRPWNTIAASAPGWRIVTLTTAPVAASTDIPSLRRRENRARQSTISWPPGISSTYGRIAADGSASFVIITGGFGLFLDPGGRPRGRFANSMLAPSPACGGGRGCGGFLSFFSPSFRLLPIPCTLSTSSENGSGFMMSRLFKIMNGLFQSSNIYLA